MDRAEADKRITEAKELKERVEKKIDETTKHLRYEKESILTLESCINETKQTLITEQKKVLQEKLDLEKEK